MNSKPIQSAFLAIAATVTLVAGAVSPALARANDPAKEAKKTDDQSDKAAQKRYCVQGTSTGTLMPKRECHTRAEWIARTGVDPVKEVQKN
ncbi:MULTISPECIES: hypothetical protein [Sphingomonas]|jgi:hypothetical protein|uniref:Uncharacterized protein n=1 Tax=Sphingomonas leidyi TaxID=68569 RepID=A0A7X5ZWL9_9SPHN|nr:MULTISPECIES: hypothetical protein [Sphingomonas]MBN8810978.1 hypothetical protein [Sphingomonas sp.]NIJ66281.1 hypothetical protein [Sphingomonas leidyi]OJY54484.1 MAG: hypothetical protein BGP17_05430 [Sphingomonas sp. 67-41]